MTHGPPHYILDLTPVRPRGSFSNAGCEHLHRAIRRVKPRLHCFGHIHQGYGALRVDWDTQEERDDFTPLPQEYVGRKQARRNGYSMLPPSSTEAFRSGNETLFINAAIGNHDEKPYQAPWLVEIDLPVDKCIWVLVKQEKWEEKVQDRFGKSINCVKPLIIIF